MKRFMALLLVLMMGVMLFSGCTGKKEEAPVEPSTAIAGVEDLEGKTVGTIVWFGVTDDVLTGMFREAYQVNIAEMKSFDSEAALVMALDTGKIDAAWLRDFQAGVYVKQVDKYNMFSAAFDKTLAGSARMVAAVNGQAAEDLTKINEALAQLKEEGVLAELQQEYITDFDFSKNYESIAMPNFAGAPTYKLSVSGSMVPLDYIAADGNPTGFSIALLAKVSELTGFNFELVTLGFGTDRMELTAGKIDYIFCYTLTDANMARETELIFSEPYYTYEGSAFLVKR